MALKPNEYFCKNCNSKLINYRKDRNTSFCSKKCYTDYKFNQSHPNYNEVKDCFCEICENKISYKQVRGSLTRRNKLPKFCSKECHNKSLKGEGNPMFETNRKHSIETLRKMSEAKVGKTKTQETRKKMSNSRKGWKYSKETLKKMRLSAIKRIEKRVGGGFKPSFNINSIKYFETFDAKNNTKGLYGENEFLIKELGYWPDYINFNLKLIMEWDEDFHYTFEDKLKNKDINRQKEIQNFFSDFEFKRIRERRIKS